ncbi:unnamed protein product [Paramecium octaurelia]|uniref:Uncharacterized protein n=1 Tax=Paramecium octaurelia TaxID=43137 RepID=A0A8S1YPF8_PAROT|nr:unnamed protein product [Paramecium octaurelia]
MQEISMQQQGIRLSFNENIMPQFHIDMVLFLRYWQSYLKKMYIKNEGEKHESYLKHKRYITVQGLQYLDYQNICSTNTNKTDIRIQDGQDRQNTQ